MTENNEQKRQVLDEADIVKMIPFLAGHPRMVRWIMRMLCIDKVNKIHSDNFDTPGPPFCAGLLHDLNIKVQVDNPEVLDNLPQGPFITVSNHPFGALDGITLINLIGSRRPEFKVMVNMFLNHISAMRPNFIAVDQSGSDDPAKRGVSLKGIKDAIRQVRSGHPIGFFPAGSVGNYNRHLRFEENPWRESIARLIRQLDVPVIPVYFHGYNSLSFRLLGIISWQLRTLRLPAEVFNKHDSTLRVTIGNPITPAQISSFAGTDAQLAAWLRDQTLALGKRP